MLLITFLSVFALLLNATVFLLHEGVNRAGHWPDVNRGILFKSVGAETAQHGPATETRCWQCPRISAVQGTLALSESLNCAEISQGPILGLRHASYRDTANIPGMTTPQNPLIYSLTISSFLCPYPPLHFPFQLCLNHFCWRVLSNLVAASR